MSEERKPTPALDAAIVKLQGMLPKVSKTMSANITKKDGTPGPKYKYADLADVSEAAMPLLSECGLAFTAFPDVDNGLFGLRYTLRHESGERDGGFYLLPDPRNTTPQQVGSAITYARRYSLCSATGIAPDGDDDDASAAQNGYRSAGDAFASASPERPQQDGGRQWKPRETGRQQESAQSAPGAGGASPAAEGDFVVKFYADLGDADEAGCHALVARAGGAIRSGEITPQVGNDLLRAAQKRKAEIRDAA
jgi:hypothetical protein